MMRFPKAKGKIQAIQILITQYTAVEGEGIRRWIENNDTGVLVFRRKTAEGGRVKCYFCKTTGTKNGVMLETTKEGILICPSCKAEAIQFWKHHHDLGLLHE